jgi:hypothetical protein
MGPLFPVVESFQTHILTPSLFYKTIHSRFQMAPICSAHSTSLVCSSIPFIVHLIDLNHLHKSSLLFWTVLNTHTTSFTYFQSLSFQQHDIQPLTNIRHTQYTSIPSRYLSCRWVLIDDTPSCSLFQHSSIPFIVHRIELNRLHHSFLLFWTLT